MWHENNIKRTNDANEIQNKHLSQNSHATDIKVCIHMQYPYIYRNDSIKRIDSKNNMKDNDVVGFYYEMWKAIRDDITLHSNGKLRFKEDFIEEKDIEKYMRNQTHMFKTDMNHYDIVIGLYNSHMFMNPNKNSHELNGNHLISTDSNSDAWSFSDPIFLRHYTIVTQRKNKMNELFTQMFLKKYLPIMLIFVVISFILGNVLYQFTPRKSRRNAIWQMLSGMMGEFGYLSEKLSDHYKKATWFSYVVNTFMLMICLYCFIYIQATINTTMIYSKNKIQNSSSFTDTPHKMRVGFPHDMKIDVEKYIAPTTKFKLVEIPKNYNDALRDYITSHKKDDGNNEEKIDGVLVDILKFKHEMHTRPNSMDEIVMIDKTYGKHPISLAINNQMPSSSLSKYKMLDEVNTAIRRLHQTEVLQRTCDYYMKENAAHHCI